VSATATTTHVAETAGAPPAGEPQTITGGHLVAKALRAEGIDTILGSPQDLPHVVRPALERARESGKPALINVWIDQNAFAPGTMNQTMHK